MQIKRIVSFGSALVLSLFSFSALMVPNASALVPAYTCTWTAGTGGGNGDFSAAANWSGCNGGAPQPGDDDNLIFDTGTPLYNNPNNDITNLIVNNITFTGNSSTFAYSLMGNPITITGGITDSTSSEFTGIQNDLIINGNQSFSTVSNTNYSSLSGSGNVTITGTGRAAFDDLSGYTGTLSSADSNIILQTFTSFTSSGAVAVSSQGTLSLDDESARDDPGTFTLPISLGGEGVGKAGALNLTGQGNGNSVIIAGSVTLTSDVNVSADNNTTLNITGHITYNGHTISSIGQNTSTITVAPGDDQSSQNPTVGNNVTFFDDGTVGNTTVANGGVLKGNGTLGNTTIQSGGKIAPGHSPGCLNTGNFTLNGILDEEIAGPAACTEYDQIKVTGTVDLGNGTLNIILYNGFKPAAGQSYTIISNDGADAVTGTFNNLAEGATFTVGGYVLKITYKGGDGNDVVLSVQSIPATPNTGSSLIATHPLQTFLATTFLAGAIAVIARRYKKMLAEQHIT